MRVQHEIKWSMSDLLSHPLPWGSKQNSDNKIPLIRETRSKPLFVLATKTIMTGSNRIK